MVCAAHDALADVLIALVEMAPAMCSAAPLPPAVAAKASGGCGGQLYRFSKKIHCTVAHGPKLALRGVT
eukprot:COSAG01_NODE_27216_length_691_cov_1.108108_1_plen_68_part_01